MVFIITMGMLDIQVLFEAAAFSFWWTTHKNQSKWPGYLTMNVCLISANNATTSNWAAQILTKNIEKKSNSKVMETFSCCKKNAIKL